MSRRTLIVFAAAATALALIAPAAAGSGRLTKADRAAITRTIDAFVYHAVAQHRPTAAYDLVTKNMRVDTTRADWRRGESPVYPYPAAGRHFEWTLAYAEPHRVGVDLLLKPRRGHKVDDMIFNVDLKRVGPRWLIDAMVPAASLAPAGSKPKVVAAPDWGPGAAGASSESKGRVSAGIGLAIILLLPGAGLLVLLAVWALSRYRSRVAERRYGSARSLPPLPSRGRQPAD